jgi:hypothetical protein
MRVAVETQEEGPVRVTYGQLDGGARSDELSSPTSSPIGDYRLTVGRELKERIAARLARVHRVLNEALSARFLVQGDEVDAPSR